MFETQVSPRFAQFVLPRPFQNQPLTRECKTPTGRIFAYKCEWDIWPRLAFTVAITRFEPSFHLAYAPKLVTLVDKTAMVLPSGKRKVPFCMASGGNTIFPSFHLSFRFRLPNKFVVVDNL